MTVELECLACAGRAFGVLPDSPEPRPGDLVFCGRCGAVHAFTDDLTLRYPVDDDLRQLFNRDARALDVDPVLTVRVSTRARGSKS